MQFRGASRSRLLSVMTPLPGKQEPQRVSMLRIRREGTATPYFWNTGYSSSTISPKTSLHCRSKNLITIRSFFEKSCGSLTSRNKWTPSEYICSLLDNNVFFVSDNALVACLDPAAKMTTEFFIEIAKLKPGIAFFRDDAFADDSARTNLQQAFDQFSPMYGGLVLKVVLHAYPTFLYIRSP